MVGSVELELAFISARHPEFEISSRRCFDPSFVDLKVSLGDSRDVIFVVRVQFRTGRSLCACVSCFVINSVVSLLRLEGSSERCLFHGASEIVETGTTTIRRVVYNLGQTKLSWSLSSANRGRALYSSEANKFLRGLSLNITGDIIDRYTDCGSVQTHASDGQVLEACRVAGGRADGVDLGVDADVPAVITCKVAMIGSGALVGMTTTEAINHICTFGWLRFANIGGNMTKDKLGKASPVVYEAFPT